MQVESPDSVYRSQSKDRPSLTSASSRRLTRLTVGHDTLPFTTRTLNKDLYLQIAYERYINFGVVTDVDYKAYIVT